VYKDEDIGFGDIDLDEKEVYFEDMDKNSDEDVVEQGKKKSVKDFSRCFHSEIENVDPNLLNMLMRNTDIMDRVQNPGQFDRYGRRLAPSVSQMPWKQIIPYDESIYETITKKRESMGWLLNKEREEEDEENGGMEELKCSLFGKGENE
jgi:hypothetical protein